ncbi:rhodanese-like domain-containing protein [Flectobacillus sp. DC10W]|jgi:rhodanese-related sulfurtransferase|uniref:Rhodanese-like domain-containing protein n=1 Tax=Flectobacillus longus TaxID=2984207 RepID=A0ABT6YKV3_9BACT|nr:rhodanese-like domain-containing protein [Flectobacillus longus]MDI9864087.1 rhodanese-like domain-containing protein [Flectobacillus longus]
MALFSKISIVLFALLACTSNPNIITLAPKSFQQELNKQASKNFIDVRTQGEAARGMIAGAILIDISSSDFESKLQKLDKNKATFVYCASGIRSKRAASQLLKLGFKKVYNLDGGIIAWSEEGLPIK